MNLDPVPIWRSVPGDHLKKKLSGVSEPYLNKIQTKKKKKRRKKLFCYVNIEEGLSNVGLRKCCTYSIFSPCVRVCVNWSACGDKVRISAELALGIGGIYLHLGFGACLIHAAWQPAYYTVVHNECDPLALHSLASLWALWSNTHSRRV